MYQGLCSNEVGIETSCITNVTNMFVILSAPEPNPPDQVTITQTTCNSVTVNWTSPTDNGNAEITQYRVHVYKDTDHLTGLINDTTQMSSHRVTSLEPGTNYTVELTAGNVGGFGNKSSTKLSTTRKGERTAQHHCIRNFMMQHSENTSHLYCAD